MGFTCTNFFEHFWTRVYVHDLLWRWLQWWKVTTGGFVQKFSEIYPEIQVIPCDSGDMKQNCPVFSTPCRTFWPCMKPLELYRVFHFVVCYLTVVTEIPSKINTGGEAHDRPAHPLHKPSEVAPEKLHQRLMWPLMFKKVHAKDCRAEEKQHWAMYYFLQQASKQIKWALEDICLLFPAHTALFCFIARELHGWCHFFSEENRPPEPFTDIINYL